MRHNKAEIKLFLSLLLLLSALGALNWAVVGIWGFDLVSYLFETRPIVIRAIYITIGVAGFILILLFGKIKFNTLYI